MLKQVLCLFVCSLIWANVLAQDTTLASASFLTNPGAPDSNALSHFYRSLPDAGNQIIHIAHYGASESEGDRITSDIRSLLQQEFGGSAIGFVPLVDYTSNVSMTRSSSANWKQYNVFSNRTGNNLYGISGTVYKFTDYSVIRNDSLAAVGHKDSVTYRWHNNATLDFLFYKSYQRMYLTYGNSTEACYLTVYDKNTGAVIAQDTLPASQGINKYKIKLTALPRNIRMEFKAGKSPDFYGLFLEGAPGVEVDNYAIRGHSGDGLMLVSSAYLSTQAKQLNTKLIVFQYGINAVPWLKDEAGCQWTADIYARLFAKYRKALPDVSIVVIGVGDLAFKNSSGLYQSYPIIPTFRDKMKEAALKSGCAYWDIYEAMGGQNSLITWYRNGYAGLDGHFTQSGNLKIATLFVEDLLRDYKAQQ